MNVIEAIRTRRSVREYRPDAVPGDVLDRMIEALRVAPSACNYQPWGFIFVTQPDLREQLARACHGQSFIAEAPVVVVGCGFPLAAYARMGETWSSVEIDVAIAIDHLTLAAAAEGLGTCWIGSYNETAVKRLLGIPARVKVVALTPLGYPAREGLLRPVTSGERKPTTEVISFERF
jgi:nitroreductase